MSKSCAETHKWVAEKEQSVVIIIFDTSAVVVAIRVEGYVRTRLSKHLEGITSTCLWHVRIANTVSTCPISHHLEQRGAKSRDKDR